MKNNLKILTFSVLSILASCSNDSDSDTSANDEETAQLESTPLEANHVSDNVVINGGTKNDGAPPTPNEAISLDVSSSSNTAFLNEGFEIELDSDADITGAYLQFKANDGSFADSYYDIDVSANTSSKKAIGNLLRKRADQSRFTAKEEETILDIDFNSQLEPGTFCYVICVYDADGNISAPEEVCVTVEAWGGNNSLVADWELTKEEETYDGETMVFDVGTPSCQDITVQCDQAQDEVDFSLCYTQEYGRIGLNADGTFTIDFKAIDEDYNYQTVSSTCEADKEEEVYRFQVEGNWAYVDGEKRLTLVGYNFTVEEDGETETEVLNGGEGELVFDGTAEVNGNVLTIYESYDFDGNGTVDEAYKFYFEK